MHVMSCDVSDNSLLPIGSMFDLVSDESHEASEWESMTSPLRPAAGVSIPRPLSASLTLNSCECRKHYGNDKIQGYASAYNS